MSLSTEKGEGKNFYTPATNPSLLQLQRELEKITGTGTRTDPGSIAVNLYQRDFCAGEHVRNYNDSEIIIKTNNACARVSPGSSIFEKSGVDYDYIEIGGLAIEAKDPVVKLANLLYILTKVVQVSKERGKSNDSNVSAILQPRLVEIIKSLGLEIKLIGSNLNYDLDEVKNLIKKYPFYWIGRNGLTELYRKVYPNRKLGDKFNPYRNKYGDKGRKNVMGYVSENIDGIISLMKRGILEPGCQEYSLTLGELERQLEIVVKQFLSESRGISLGSYQRDIIRGKKITVVGGGSVGSRVLSALSSYPVAELAVFDGGMVGQANLPRLSVGTGKVGEIKVIATKEYIAGIYPMTNIITNPYNIDAKNIYEIEALKPDVIFCSVDDLEAMTLLHEYALRHSIPLILMTDFGYAVYVHIFQYDSTSRRSSKLFCGRLSNKEIKRISTSSKEDRASALGILMKKLFRRVPIDVILALGTQIMYGEQFSFIPQSREASNLVESITPSALCRALSKGRRRGGVLEFFVNPNEKILGSIMIRRIKAILYLLSARLRTGRSVDDVLPK